MPLLLPVAVEGEEKKTYEAVFSEAELNFLSHHQCYSNGDKQVNGGNVWVLYRQLNEMKMGMTESQVSKKIMQGILSKFTFSFFYTEKLKTQLSEYSNPEKGFDDYLYLSHYVAVYDYVAGLDQSRFDSTENSIL